MTYFPKYKERGAYHHQWYKDNTFGYRVLAECVVDFCKGSTLDLGCGDGLVAKLIAERGYEVLGVDSDIEGINLARQYNDKARFEVQNIDSGTTFDGFEYLACLNTIEHLENPHLIANIFAKGSFKAAIIITDKAMPTPGKYHVHEFTKQELWDLFEGYHRQTFTLKITDDDYIGIKIWK